MLIGTLFGELVELESRTEPGWRLKYLSQTGLIQIFQVAENLYVIRFTCNEHMQLITSPGLTFVDSDNRLCILTRNTYYIFKI